MCFEGSQLRLLGPLTRYITQTEMLATTARHIDGMVEADQEQLGPISQGHKMYNAKPVSVLE